MNRQVRNLLGLIIAATYQFWGLSCAGMEVHQLRRGSMAVEVTIDDPSLAMRFGPRFDRCGSVTRFEIEGRNLVHQWGLVDEFGLEGVGVLGFDASRADGTFLKIGVGELRKKGPGEYFFKEAYSVVVAYPIGVTATNSKIEVKQESSRVAGYAYRYTKRYRLTEPGQLEISYQLANTGTQQFTAQHYNHNFLRFPEQPPGPAYRIVPAFVASLENNEEFDFNAGVLRLIQPHGGYIGGPVAAGRSSPNEVEVSAGEVRLVIGGDFIPVRFAAWSGEDAISPEVFGEVTVAPGESVEWKRIYRAILKVDQAGPSTRVP